MIFKKKKKRFLIFDSGPLINFSMTGNLHILKKLHTSFGGEFLITKEVKEEIIDRPLNIKRFKLGALRLKDLFDRGIIKYADINEAQVNELRDYRNKLMERANNTFKSKKKSIHLIDKGEAAALALCKILGGNVPLVIDERTTRMLVENPKNLRKLLEKKLHKNIKANPENYELFKNFKIIRSTELLYVAFKKGMFVLKNKELFDALLYSAKINGVSISEAEVEKMKVL